MKDDFNKKPKSRTEFQYVPVFCYDYKYREPKDEQVAAKWAWASVGRLASLFCEQYCDRASCNVEDSKYLPKELKYSDRKDYKMGESKIDYWQHEQSILHRALAFLPNLNVEYETTCFACNILMAFALFPRLIIYSPVSPIATIRRNIDRDGKKIIRNAGMKDMSIPCYVVEFISGDNIEIDPRIREDVLLKFDANNLPGITPDEYEIITRYLTRAHLITKEIYALAFPKEYENLVQNAIEVEFAQKEDGWHWFVDGNDTGVWCKRVKSNKYIISQILFNQIRCGWIPHETFYQAVGWDKDVYFDRTGDKGRMQKELNKLRKRMGVKIDFRKAKGVKFEDNIVKAPK